MTKPSPSTRKRVAASHSKYSSYKYAMFRMGEAIKERFYLEAVMIAESIISDRLLSVTARKQVAAPATKHVGLATLINRAKRVGLPADLATELDGWRDARNQVAHAVAKSSPGELPMSVSGFCELAAKTARDGEQLVVKVKHWTRSVH